MVDKKGDITDKLTAVSKRKIFEEVANQIRNLIEEGELKTGDKLPTERELSRIFKVSRHSVREALRTLEQEKMVTSQQGSGTFVLLRHDDILLDYLAEAIAHEKNQLSQIFQFRRTIESEIAYLATLHISEAQLKQLREIINRQEQESSSLIQMELDQGFHHVLAEAAQNQIMLVVLDRVNDILSKTREQYLSGKTRVEYSIAGHYRILEAIEKRDAENARAAMKEHLDEIEKIALNGNQ